jgi:hypothetical protein
VQFLAEAGLLELKKTKDGREKIKPLVNPGASAFTVACYGVSERLE